MPASGACTVASSTASVHVMPTATCAACMWMLWGMSLKSVALILEHVNVVGDPVDGLENLCTKLQISSRLTFKLQVAQCVCMWIFRCYATV